MRAPSEKHLEDWIVANPEWFGPSVDWEEFSWPNCDPDTVKWTNQDDFVMPAFKQIIARQPRMPIGIPDLITTNEYQLNVVELKAGAVDAKTIAQCLRYMACLREIMTWTYWDRTQEIASLPDWSNHRELSGYPEGEIAGIVVGNRVEDKNLYWVAALSNIEIYTYDYHPENNLYVFDCLHIEELEGTPRSSVYREWAQGAVGDAIISVFNYWDKLKKDREVAAIMRGES